jgi:hypothetical protein
MPREARRRSSPDAEEFDSDCEVSPSGHRRRRLNVRSPSNYAANEEPSVSLNDILSLRNGKKKLVMVRRRCACRSSNHIKKIVLVRLEICQRLEQLFEAVEQSMRGEIGEVTTRVDEVSEHVNVVANQVDRVVRHVNNVNGRLDNVINRLQRLERSQNVGSPSGESTEIAARDVGRTRSGRQYTGERVVRGSRQPSTIADTDIEGEPCHPNSIELGREVMDRSLSRNHKISSSHDSHSSPAKPVSRVNNKRNVTVVDSVEMRATQARVLGNAMPRSNEQDKHCYNDCYSEAECSEESDREITFGNVGKKRDTAARSDDVGDRQPVGASPMRGSYCSDGKSATVRNDAIIERENDANDDGLHDGKTRTCCNNCLSPVGKSRGEMRTSPSSDGRRSDVINLRCDKTYRKDKRN